MKFTTVKNTTAAYILLGLTSFRPAEAACGGNQLCNPLSMTSITGFLNAILDILLIFAMPIIIFFIVFAGFKYVTAQGNPTEISKANKALMYALIGGAIILGAQVIGTVITETVDTFR